MATRSPIPAELKRRVLLEAGHRCAIHTCRHPDVDVHHIVPWSARQEHAFENLIALCPNCHRRAHQGQIDRKSLLLYKARLFNSPNVAGIYPLGLCGSEEVFSWQGCDAQWEVLTLKDFDLDLKVNIAIEYPRFLKSTTSLLASNYYIFDVVELNR